MTGWQLCITEKTVTLLTKKQGRSKTLYLELRGSCTAILGSGSRFFSPSPVLATEL